MIVAASIPPSYSIFWFTKKAPVACKAALLKQVSPVAWQHINLYGRYEFSRWPETINIHASIQDLSQIQAAPELAPTT